MALKKDFTEDFKKVKTLLRDLRLNDKEWAKMIHASQKQASKPIITKARGNLINSPAFKQIRTYDGYSKLLHVMRGIFWKKMPFKKNSAVSVISINYKLPDVEVKGSKRPKWTIWGWAMLLAKGRKWTSKGARRSHWTGTTEGAGDYTGMAAEQLSSVYFSGFKRAMVLKANAFIRRMQRKGGGRK